MKFSNNFSVEDDTADIAKSIRELLNLDSLNAKSFDDCSFRKQLSNSIEKLGILVVFSGTVDGNNSRPLDLNEFRGFSLYNEKTPLIFVNSKDSYKAQNFTIMHEFGHILLKQSGVTNSSPTNENKFELWCNKLAGQVLLPDFALKNKEFSEELIDTLSETYNVSKLVVISRMYFCKLIS
jgi:Zn-dependent peptidase ImmA (M78 family)